MNRRGFFARFAGVAAAFGVAKALPVSDRFYLRVDGKELDVTNYRWSYESNPAPESWVKEVIFKPKTIKTHITVSDELIAVSEKEEPVPTLTEAEMEFIDSAPQFIPEQWKTRYGVDGH